MKIKLEDTTKTEISEHDIVISTEQIEEVPVNKHGTVVHVFENSVAYLVEFQVNGEHYIKTIIDDEDNK